MTRRGIFGLVLGLASTSLLAACDNSVTSKTFPPIRYKLTAEVDTPHGVKTGHSVIEVQWSMSGSMFGTQGGSGFNVTGEAVAVDLAPGQTLFALLRSDTDVDWAAYVPENVPVVEKDESGVKDRGAKMAATQRYLDRLRANHGVYPVKKRPYFVRFRDLRDPKTVEEVDPDDLAKSYGGGYRLKALTVQMTDEPVTMGIESRLGWLVQPRVLIEHPAGTSIKDIPPVELLNSFDFLRKK
jgi:hypothetical protein